MRKTSMDVSMIYETNKIRLQEKYHKNIKFVWKKLRTWKNNRAKLPINVLRKKIVKNYTLHLYMKLFTYSSHSTYTSLHSQSKKKKEKNTF